MSDIPEDVMRAAYDAALSYRHDKATDPIHHDGALQECIARAILAERERCVAIAVEVHNEWVDDFELWCMSTAATIIAERINNA